MDHVAVKCLAPNECSEWLRSRKIIEAPYRSNETAKAFRFQCQPPTKPGQITALTRTLFDSFGQCYDVLLVFDDWSLYQPDEMAVVQSLRRAHGEEHPLTEKPGHLFSANERAEAVGHCYLALIFGWSAYLYLSTGVASLYFWEGDLIDFYTSDNSLTERLREILNRFALRIK